MKCTASKLMLKLVKSNQTGHDCIQTMTKVS